MSNWDFKLPFGWTIRGGWCTRDKVGGANYSTEGLRNALSIQRKTAHLPSYDAQVVTYSLILTHKRSFLRWAMKEWQTEFTLNFHPTLRIRRYTHTSDMFKYMWLEDKNRVWKD